MFGVEFAAPRVDLDKLRAFKDGVVAKMTGGTGQLSKLAQDPLRAGPRDHRRSDTRCRWR